MRPGRKRMNYQTLRILCVETGKEYIGLDAAARALSAELAGRFDITGPDAEMLFYGTCMDGIRKTVKGEHPTYKGYHWLGLQ